MAAREAVGGGLRLLVVAPDGVVSAIPWGGNEPSTLEGVTIRADGWVFVQSWGQFGVKAFQPN